MDLRDEETKSSSSLKLKRLNRDSWIPFAKLLIALFGIKGCRIPIRVARPDVVVATYPGSTDVAAAQASWDLENQKAFDLLMLALSNCPEGQTVLSAFEYNPASVDIADPKKYADDGRGAYLQLELNALGGKGITTGSYYMRILFDMKLKDVSVKERITRHNEACHRLPQCQNVTLDSLLTAHFCFSSDGLPSFPCYSAHIPYANNVP